jgi:hypothetical protein
MWPGTLYASARLIQIKGLPDIWTNVDPALAFLA